MKMFYEKDTDSNLVKDKKIAILSSQLFLFIFSIFSICFKSYKEFEYYSDKFLLQINSQ